MGAGTIIRFQMRILGSVRLMRSEVSEPEPGRVLMEADLDNNNARTTFRVTDESAEACLVEIATQWETRGLRGWIERMTGPPLLRRIYAAELQQLAAIAHSEARRNA